jgi:hypothetical protein
MIRIEERVRSLENIVKNLLGNFKFKPKFFSWWLNDKSPLRDIHVVDILTPKSLSSRILPYWTLVKNVSNLTIVRLFQWPGPPRVVCKMWRLWLHVKLNVQVAYILFVPRWLFFLIIIVLLRSDVSAIGWLEANRTTHRLVFCHNKMCLVKIKMNRCEIVLRIKSGFPKINKKVQWTSLVTAVCSSM